jgi:hypothetical protein
MPRRRLAASNASAGPQQASATRCCRARCAGAAARKCRSTGHLGEVAALAQRPARTLTDRPPAPSPPQEPPPPQELPQDALLCVAGHSEIDDKRRLRAASRDLCAAASESVATLQALDAQLPPAAWAAFPLADGLRLQQLASPQLSCSAGGNGRSNPTPAAAQRCAQLLRDAPARLRRLQFESHSLETTHLGRSVQSLVSWPENMDPDFGGPVGHSAQDLQRFFQLSTASTQRLATALAQSPAAPQLRDLLLDWEVLASALGDALAACPRLQSLRLKGATFPWAEHPWSPTFPQGLTSLELESTWQDYLRIQTPALAGLTALRHLALEAVDLVEPPAGGAALGRPDLRNSPFRRSMGALGRLTSLQSLRVEYDGDFCWPAFSAALTELAPLACLTSLVLGGCSLKPAAWATLAQLPQLARLEIDSMDTPPLAQAAPLAALTSLAAWSLRIPEGAPAGALSATLPSLLQLELKRQVDAALLQGHPCLPRLHLMMDYRALAKPWGQQVLCTMPQLQEVCVEGFVAGADGLLADLAACTGLRSIRVLWRAHGISIISAAGIRALAGAASSSTLESIVLGREDEVKQQRVAKYSDEDRLALADALPLLQAPMPRLRELRVPVLSVGDGELGALARQLGRPLDVVRAQLGLDVEGAGA